MTSIDTRSSFSAPGTVSLRRVDRPHHFHHHPHYHRPSSPKTTSLVRPHRHRILPKKTLIVTSSLTAPAKRSLVSLIGYNNNLGGDVSSSTTSVLNNNNNNNNNSSLRSTRCSSFYSAVVARLALTNLSSSSTSKSSPSSKHRPASELARSKRYHYNLLYYYQNRHRTDQTTPTCDRLNDNYNTLSLSRSSSTRSLIEHNIGSNNRRRFLDRLRRKKDFDHHHHHQQHLQHHQQQQQHSVVDINKECAATDHSHEKIAEECCRLLNSQEEYNNNNQLQKQPADNEEGETSNLTTTNCYNPPNPYYTHFHPYCGHRRFSPASYFYHHHHTYNYHPLYQHHHYFHSRPQSYYNLEHQLPSPTDSVHPEQCTETGLVSASASSNTLTSTTSANNIHNSHLHHHHNTDNDDEDEDSNQFNCLATIMEVLPLFLLLTMGVVISTTCAKFTLHSNFSEKSIANRSAHLSYHGDGSSSNSYGHHHQEHLLSMMIHNDDEYSAKADTVDQESVTSSMNDMLKSNHAGGQRLHQQGNYPKTAQQQRFMSQLDAVRRQYSVMRLRWLTNDSVTCNDGTRAGYYIRPSPNSRRWLIYLEGGWYCMSKSACDQRWSKMREFMTSFRWSEFKTCKSYHVFVFCFYNYLTLLLKKE